MEKRAAQSATRAISVLPPKSTILEIVEATELLILVMMSTPKKLKNALMKMARLGGMQRVVTQVAMALGASVQPLTKMTPSVRSVVIASTGLEETCVTNPAKETSNMIRPSVLY